MPFSGTGSGTAQSPYMITNLSQLNEIHNDLSAYYKLKNNIDASTTNGWTWSGGTGWEPIGNLSTPFIGSIDGNGKTITSIYTNTSTVWTGFIGVCDGAIIKNLHLHLTEIYGFNTVGALIGAALNSTIQECCCTGPGNIKLNNYDNIATQGVGGMIGLLQDTIVTNCFAKVAISSTPDTTFLNFGGFVGKTSGQTTTYCYSASTYKNMDGSGFSGESSSSVSNCYWDTTASGTSSSASGVGKTTTQMTTQSTYVGYDFTNIWRINASENNGYPILRTFDNVSPILTVKKEGNQVKWTW